MFQHFGVDAWRESRVLYRDDGEEARWLRAQHLAAIQRLTPPMMAANLLNAAVVGIAVGTRTPTRFALWLAALALCVGLGLRGHLRWRSRTATAASRRAFRRATWQAGALAATWAAVPLLWFAHASHDGRLLIATLTTGMLSAGAFALAPAPRASLAWVGVLGVGSLGALAIQRDPLFPGVVALLFTYAGICGIGALASCRKSVALLHAEREAERQRRTIALLLSDFEEHAAEALWETDARGRLTHTSPRLGELLGASANALLGNPLADVLAQRSPEGARRVESAFAEARAFRGLVMAVPLADGFHWWKTSGKPVLAHGGALEGWRGVIVDATAEVRAERKLRQLAHTDSLTGVANRVTLHDALAAQLRAGHRGALFSIDLDHFKAINDTLGHSAGDRVLGVVASRLGVLFRPDDVVARLGGDEFAVLVRTPLERAAAEALAQRAVASFAEPCAVAGHTIPVRASVGIALFPEHGRAPDDVLGNADLALYEVKRSGRGRFAIYESRLGERHRRRHEIEHALARAIDAGALALHWQPHVELRTRRIVGAEALLRWSHPTLGPISPVEFVAVAEQTGLAGRLGTWVLRAACREAARSLPDLDVSVNVSAIQLREDFVATVREALAESGLAPQRLQLELTESIFLGDDAAALEHLRALQGIGVRVALDDFGTGYSSLAYLRRFPFDTLKIDRAFVSELPHRSDVQAIVRTIVQLADSLRIRTVAEGVESDEQLAALARSGCQMIQGFLVAKPTDVAALVRWRESWPGEPAGRAALH